MFYKIESINNCDPKYSPSDGGSVTWYEPSPVSATSNTAEVLPPGIVQVYEGSSATINWNFSLSVGLGLGFIIKFNTVGIVNIGRDGSAAGPIRAEFQKRFNVSATPQTASLSISPVTIADDKSNGEFSCELNDANGDTWKRAIQVHVIGKLRVLLTIRKAYPNCSILLSESCLNTVLAGKKNSTSLLTNSFSFSLVYLESKT